MAKYICHICGHIAEGEDMPETCAQCRAEGLGFEKLVGDRIWREEHRVGIARNVDPQIAEELRAIFIEESTEVGMYLAMGRAADREGYPEVAEAYRRVAFEEAEHAARLAELLGEVVTSSTLKNLSQRVEGEFTATSRKGNVALLAKKFNYDAIYAALREMARDESRHGKLFEGLIKRYFDQNPENHRP